MNDMTHTQAKLQRAAEKAQLERHPLPPHKIAHQPEHLRWHYALLLAAMLSAQPAISSAQTRLLRLLLDALKLGDIRAALFEEARTLDEATLLEAARLLTAAKATHFLVTDALVLLRLDAPLDDDATQRVSALAELLGLATHALAGCAQAAATVLGLMHGPDDARAAELWPADYPKPKHWSPPKKKIIIGAHSPLGKIR